MSASPPAPTRTLKKASSFADLAKRQLRRFKPKADFDFGCQGDAPRDILEEEDSDEQVPERERRPRPRLPFPTAATSPPSRPQAPFEVIDESQFTRDQLRDLERQKEEALAASACLEYIHTTRTQTSHRRQHSRTHSRSSSFTASTSLSPGLERLHLHDRDPTVTLTESTLGSISARGVGHARTDSNSSSLCSSRPRTNDSLPSFASSDAATYSSAGSYPPSPVQTNRPTFSTSTNAGGGGVGGTIKKLDSDDPANQPRAYAFI